MKCRRIAIWSLLALSIVLFASVSSLQADDSTLGREAVRRGTNPIWVDRSNNEVKSPSQQLERSDVSDRHDSIRQNSSGSFWDRWFNSNRGNGNTNWAISDWLTWLFGAWRILIAVMIAILLGLALYVLFRTRVLHSLFRRRARADFEEDLEQQRSRISDLPFDIEQPILGLRAQAERFRAAGDYPKALIYLFSYLLVELDKAHCIRLERGKTNGEYLRELRSWPELSGSMKPIVQLFESVYFGRNPLDRESLDRVWTKLPSMEGAIAQVRTSKNREEPAVLMPMLSRSGV
jgi:hypothetical protein